MKKFLFVLGCLALAFTVSITELSLKKEAGHGETLSTHYVAAKFVQEGHGETL
ncbi:hypothetical protein WD019_05490 [Fictibacillus sp. Mic-4]|uniref:hypothetical protein n=1 Tax=Fictibacillus TaxID=1329200 RepID=UPI0003FCF9B2|nr:hypothetical protein [Fictibacillus gelatini]